MPKIDNYENKNKIEYVKINEIPTTTRNVIIMNEKDKIKLIKTIERIVRSSMEYKQYIQYLRDEIDMTLCSFFNNINNKNTKKISIEIHHEPFTLFDLTQIVLDKWVNEEKDIIPLLIAEQVVLLHYKNTVGLIPLCVTVHELVHHGKLFIPLQNLFGNFVSFIEEYEKYISKDLLSLLEAKFKISKELSEPDMSILEKKYIYLEIKGFTFPQIIEDAS